ncbi:MAG TPA: hypothetical protein VE258_05660, partial [Ktedonobacterales bacterium]|nr:hypothetical protein [Ktedonobacterales bacterium]
HAYYRSLDLMALGDSVSWVSPEPVPVWVDIAREYTEQWVHQAQIRDALGMGIGGIRERRLFAPVLATFMLALPYALRKVAAADGTRLHVVITGEAGGEWFAVRSAGAWTLRTSCADEADETKATLDDDTAWRLWTRGLPPEAGLYVLQASGDARLAMTVRDMVTFIG